MDLTQLVISILAVMFGALAGWIARVKLEGDPVGTSRNWSFILSDVIPVLVHAAEQLYGAGEGAKKLDYVLKQADGYLHELGLHIKPELIRAWIEATVHEMGNDPDAAG
jgi:hypothetical protein